jgi:hypothetical protein
LERAQPRDLRYFCRPDAGLRYQAPSDITKQDIVEPVPLSEHNVTIQRCEWEDIALATTTQKSVGSNVEFFDLAASWADPPEGEAVHCLGFPVSHGVLSETKQIGSVTQKTVVLVPVYFSGEVLPYPTEDELKFKITAFDPARHYLIPFEPAKQGKQPHGVSGAAAWIESKESHVVWAPRFRFAGICTVCYKNGTIEQVVKASAVRHFLQEVFGTP